MHTVPAIALFIPSVLLTGLVLVGTGLGWISPVVSVGVLVGLWSVLGAGVGVASMRPDLQIFGPAICRGSPQGQGVALTFDDGPDPRSTPLILDALEQADARATFFLLADRVRTHPDLAKRIAAHHEIGLHGLTHHAWLTVLSPDQGARELTEALSQIEDVCGVRPTTFRPPFGAVSPRLMASVRRVDLTVVWCSVRTYDGGRRTPQGLRATCAGAKAGDIVLLHEGERPTRTVLPEILADLAARGLRAVSVRELLR